MEAVWGFLMTHVRFSLRKTFLLLLYPLAYTQQIEMSTVSVGEWEKVFLSENRTCVIKKGVHSLYLHCTTCTTVYLLVLLIEVQYKGLNSLQARVITL